MTQNIVCRFHHSSSHYINLVVARRVSFWSFSCRKKVLIDWKVKWCDTFWASKKRNILFFIESLPKLMRSIWEFFCTFKKFSFMKKFCVSDFFIIVEGAHTKKGEAEIDNRSVCMCTQSRVLKTQINMFVRSSSSRRENWKSFFFFSTFSTN